MPSNEQQQEQDSSLGLVQITSRVMLHLAPYYMGRIDQGIHATLNSYLMRYNKRLGGVPLSYDRVAPIQDTGRIMGESPFLHFHVKVTWCAFAPQIHQILTAVVNLQSSDHIGLLVHKTFNVTIPASRLMTLTRCVWRKDLGAWCFDRQKVVQTGTTLAIQVVSLEHMGNMLTIMAQLAPDAIEKVENVLTVEEAKRNKEESEVAAKAAADAALAEEQELSLSSQVPSQIQLQVETPLDVPLASSAIPIANDLPNDKDSPKKSRKSKSKKKDA